MNLNPQESELRGKRVVVMGLGRFGGGLGITRYFVEAGASVVVTDTADKQTLASTLKQLNDLVATNRLKIIHGPHDTSLLENADILVVSPAVPVPWKHPFVVHAQSTGVRVTTEIEIAYRHLDPSRIIAITGSAGKSTTSAMIHHILESAGHHPVLAGNIGGSVLTQLDEITDHSIIVLELSSAMIYWLWGHDTDPPPPPAVACITNYTPNHIDWHGGVSHYKESKKKLLAVLESKGTAILGPSLHDWDVHTEVPVRVIEADEAIDGCVIPGGHNGINAAMAVHAAMAITRTHDYDQMSQAVRGFGGLPHRLNKHLCSNGLVIVNDSKSTVPEATLLAVEALAETIPMDSIHLIAGGADKGSDLSSIAALHSQIAGMYTIGSTGQSLAQGDNAHYCVTLEKALECALTHAKPGDTILLSPGCASWDQFTNYEQRGDLFVLLAQQLTQSTSC